MDTEAPHLPPKQSQLIRLSSDMVEPEPSAFFLGIMRARGGSWVLTITVSRIAPREQEKGSTIGGGSAPQAVVVHSALLDGLVLFLQGLVQVAHGEAAAVQKGQALALHSLKEETERGREVHHFMELPRREG